MPYTLIQGNYGAIAIVFHMNIFVNCILLCMIVFVFCVLFVTRDSPLTGFRTNNLIKIDWI